MASPALLSIPEDLLVEIFLRLPTLAALAHAVAACTYFRRIIKSRAFRRRFRALHRPPLLGFMDAAGFHPADAPVSSASCFSIGIDDDELPRWRPRDARDDRVLLDWVSLHPRSVRTWVDPEDGSQLSVLMDCNELADPGAGARATWAKRERHNIADFHLAICDPLSRRYAILPTIPDDLAAQPGERLIEFVPLLAPTTADDGEDDSLKVIYMARYVTKIALFVFLSTNRQWCKWSIATFPIYTPPGALSIFDCVRGCFYFYLANHWEWSDYLLSLDTRTMRFSTIDLLTGYHVQLRDLPDQSIGRRRPCTVVVGREGALEMFSLVCQNESFALYHTSLQSDSQEWKLEKIIPLPGQYKDYSISTVGAAEGFFCSFEVLQKTFIMRKWIVTHWMSRLTKSPRSVARWRSSSIAKMQSPTLASRHSCRNRV